MPVLIETVRLRLREWEPDDESAFQRLVSEPEVARFAGADDLVEQGVPFIERMTRDQRELGWSLWAVELRQPTSDDPTGPIGWTGFGADSLPDPELAWTFLPDVWGRGYATEAGIAARDYGFVALGMTHMVSVIDERNLASARVAEKVGLERRRTIVCHGEPHLVFEMDIERWRQIVGDQ